MPSEIGVDEERLTGFVDHLVGSRLYGWAVDLTHPMSNVGILVFAGQALVAFVRSGEFRSDLVSLTQGGGLHGFTSYLPSTLANLEFDCIRVFAVTHRLANEIEKRHSVEDENDALHYLANFLKHRPSEIKLLSISDVGNDAIETLIQVPEPKKSFGLNDAKPFFLIDVRDLLVFLKLHSRVTGIQRVVCSIITHSEFLGEYKDNAIQYCLLAEKIGQVRILDRKLLLELVRDVVDGALDLKSANKQILDIERQSRPYKICKNDIYFISGAYWIVEDYSRHLVKMKERGGIVGVYIYDLIPITAPQWVTKSTRQEVAERAVDTIALADFYLTISEFVKMELEQLIENELHVHRPATAVCLPHEVPSVYNPGGETTTIVPMNQSFVLCVCTLEGRKNHSLLKRVWEGLIRKYGRDRIPDLVLVGKWGWNIDDFKEEVENSQFLEHKIIIMSGLTDQALAALYRDCLFTVFPSFAEGWGLPVGESLAAGKVCITSNATSLPEVGGGFCEYFDPHDFFEAFKKIERGIFDRQWLAGKEEIIRKDFVPRTWAEVTRDLFTKMGALSLQVGQRVDQRPVRPIFSSGAIVELGKKRESQLLSWKQNMGKYSLVSGWHPIDNQGGWASTRRAELEIQTDQSQNTPVTILLKLVSPTQAPLRQVRVLCGGLSSTLSEVLSNPNWFGLRGIAGQNGVLKVVIECPIGSGHHDQDRQRFVGIGGFGYYRNDVPEDRITALQGLLMNQSPSPLYMLPTEEFR